jgi:hypothetical protein
MYCYIFLTVNIMILFVMEYQSLLCVVNRHLNLNFAIFFFFGLNLNVYFLNYVGYPQPGYQGYPPPPQPQVFVAQAPPPPTPTPAPEPPAKKSGGGGAGAAAGGGFLAWYVFKIDLD